MALSDIHAAKFSFFFFSTLFFLFVIWLLRPGFLAVVHQGLIGIEVIKLGCIDGQKQIC
jgi:hypothetical protein